MDFTIEPMNARDWKAVGAILREGIATGNATFETQAADWNVWDSHHLQDCRVIARSAEQVVGWAALSPVSDRCVYRGVAEASVYVAERARGQGIGTCLLQALVKESERAAPGPCRPGSFPRTGQHRAAQGL